MQRVRVSDKCALMGCSSTVGGSDGWHNEMERTSWDCRQDIDSQRPNAACGNFTFGRSSAVGKTL